MSRYDVRRAPASLPETIPEPSAGSPVGYKGGGHQGGAEGSGHISSMAKPWTPARTKGYAFFCKPCGLGHRSQEAADACCDPAAAVHPEPVRQLTNDQIRMVKRRTRGGDGPKAILAYMNLDETAFHGVVQHYYNSERLRLMAEKGLDLDGWKAFQRKRRTSLLWHGGAKR